LVEGVVTHDCTNEVTSIKMNWSETAGVNDAAVDPRVGMLE
jgi:hypothetical protein